MFKLKNFTDCICSDHNARNASVLLHQADAAARCSVLKRFCQCVNFGKLKLSKLHNNFRLLDRCANDIALLLQRGFKLTRQGLFKDNSLTLATRFKRRPLWIPNPINRWTRMADLWK